MAPQEASVRHVGSNVSLDPSLGVSQASLSEQRTNAQTVATNERQLSAMANSAESSFAKNSVQNEKQFLLAREELARRALERRFASEVLQLASNEEYNKDIVKFKEGKGGLNRRLLARGKNEKGEIVDEALATMLAKVEDGDIKAKTEKASEQYVPQLYKRTRERLELEQAEDVRQEIKLRLMEISALYDEANETDDAVVAGINKNEIHKKYKAIHELINSENISGNPVFTAKEREEVETFVKTALLGDCLGQRFNKIGFLPEQAVSDIVNGVGEYDFFENDNGTDDPMRLPIKLSDVPKDNRFLFVRDILEKNLKGLEMQRVVALKSYVDEVQGGAKPCNLGSAFYREAIETVTKEGIKNRPSSLTVADAEANFLANIQLEQRCIEKTKYASTSDLNSLAASLMTSPMVLDAATKALRHLAKGVTFSRDADVFYKNLGVLLYADDAICEGVPVTEVFERLKNRKPYEVTDEVMQMFEKGMSGMTFNGKPAPTSIVPIGLKDDMKRNFKTYYKDTGDFNAANKAAFFCTFKKDGWGSSVLSDGSRFVRYPVEMFYQDELHSPFTLNDRFQEYCKKTFDIEAPEDNDDEDSDEKGSIQFFVKADEQTYAEIAAGRKDPTYAIYYRDPVLYEDLPVMSHERNKNPTIERCGANVFHPPVDDVFNGENEVKRNVTNIDTQIEHTKFLLQKAVHLQVSPKREWMIKPKQEK